MSFRHTKTGFIYEGPMVAHLRSPDPLVMLEGGVTIDDLIYQRFGISELEQVDARGLHKERIHFELRVIED